MRAAHGKSKRKKENDSKVRIIVEGSKQNFYLVSFESRESLNMVLEEISQGNFQNEVQECATKRDWKKIIKLAHKYGFEISSLLLWVFPSEYCLQQLKVTLKSFNISSILSIGCGKNIDSGWIIEEKKKFSH